MHAADGRLFVADGDEGMLVLSIAFMIISVLLADGEPWDTDELDAFESPVLANAEAAVRGITAVASRFFGEDASDMVTLAEKTIRSVRPLESGISAMPWATFTVKGLVVEAAKPTSAATKTMAMANTRS